MTQSLGNMVRLHKAFSAFLLFCASFAELARTFLPMAQSSVCPCKRCSGPSQTKSQTACRLCKGGNTQAAPETCFKHPVWNIDQRLWIVPYCLFFWINAWSHACDVFLLSPYRKFHQTPLQSGRWMIWKVSVFWITGRMKARKGNEIGILMVIDLFISIMQEI